MVQNQLNSLQQENQTREGSKMPRNDSFQNRERFQRKIEKGFQLEAEGKISLKKYYESTQFQLNGYSIKYESIRIYN